MSKVDLEFYKLQNEELLTTPSLLLYPELVKANIQGILHDMDKQSLRPHIKTIKCKELVRLLMDAGVSKFKCATLTEARLLGEVGALDVIVAYPLVGWQLNRFLQLCEEFPNTTYRLIVDSLAAVEYLNQLMEDKFSLQEVLVDINLGMNRTGVSMDGLFEFVTNCLAFDHIKIWGLHGYDGHIREEDIIVREEVTKGNFERLLALSKSLETAHQLNLHYVFGGTNTFPIYKQYPFVECSPGTFVLWDYGYQSTLPEQDFNIASIVLSRVVSKPTADTICIDLGYKAIASENPLDKRFAVLGKENWTPLSQSEEHLVLQIPLQDGRDVAIGEFVYILPYHICPTVAMYPYFQTIEDKEIAARWKIVQRYPSTD